MPNVEQITEVSPEDKALREKLERLLNGPASDDYMQRQIQLACEDFLTTHPENTGHITKEVRDEIMNIWTTSGLSEYFHQLRLCPNFKTHPRFQGKIANVTLADVKYWGQHQCLPES